MKEKINKYINKNKDRFHFIKKPNAHVYDPTARRFVYYLFFYLFSDFFLFSFSCHY